MPGSPELTPQPEPDPLEVATDQAIAACDGDVRATVRALIVANALLEAVVQAARVAAAMTRSTVFSHGSISFGGMKRFGVCGLIVPA
jgi:hypothetical protein